MERISYDYFPEPSEATKEQLNELCIYLLAENKRLRELVNKCSTAFSKMEKGEFYAPVELSQVEAYQAYARSMNEFLNKH